MRPAGVETGHDDAWYLLLARSLRNLQYRDTFLPDPTVHHMYPPGYPAVLALWGAVVHDRFDLMTLLNIACMTLTFALIFAVTARLSGPGCAW